MQRLGNKTEQARWYPSTAGKDDQSRHGYRARYRLTPLKATVSFIYRGFMTGGGMLKRDCERYGVIARIAAIVLTSCLVLYSLPGEATSPDAFRVSNVPGLATQPGFASYAGYLPTSDNKPADPAKNDQMFFWLVESQTSPATDPLVIWLSGGPGCSSIAAMFEENGPFKLQHGDTVLTTDHGWNQRANVLYVDQPLQTGLSYTADGRFVNSQGGVNVDFYAFLQNFLEAFPQYKGRKLFITGESYAGHFIPAIATHILEKQGTPGAIDVTLAGLAIGNGWIDPRTHIDAAPTVAYSAGVINHRQADAAASLFETAIRQCGVTGPLSLKPTNGKPLQIDTSAMMAPFTGITLPPALASNAQAKALVALFEPYKGKIVAVVFSNRDFIALTDLLRAGPPGLADLLPPAIKVQLAGLSDAELIFNYLIGRVVSYTADAQGNAVNLMDLLNYGPVSMIGTPTAWPPGDDGFNSYMVRPDVLKALHAESFGSRPFMACNPLTYFHLGDDYFKSTAYLLPNLLRRMPVLFYNGQDDLIASALSARRLLDGMVADPWSNWPGKAEYAKAPYVPWTFKGARAGYSQSAGNLQFLVVLNASHMVPLSVPLVAQDMIGRFVHGEPIVSSGK